MELAAELEELVRETFSHYYRKEIVEDVSITLIQRGPELVPQFSKKIREKSLRILKKKWVEVMLNTSVKAVSASDVTINNDIKMPTETVIWVGGVKPANVKFVEAVGKSPDGRIPVNQYLQVENYKEVFAIGDVASLKDPEKNAPLPQLAQVAEKEARTAARNIKNLIEGKNLETFSYHSTGNLMSIGKWRALGEIKNFTFSGHIAWFIWRTVYLSKLISFRKKVRVAVDWTMNLFSPRDISQL